MSHRNISLLGNCIALGHPEDVIYATAEFFFPLLPWATPLMEFTSIKTKHGIHIWQSRTLLLKIIS